MNDDFVISTRGLTKKYGMFLFRSRNAALSELTIDIPRGAVFGFLGPNGAGKTTTIKLLMDLIKPTAGSAMVLGRPADDVEVKSRIGFLPDTPSFSPQLIAVEFLSICAKLLKIPSSLRRDRIQEALEIVKMTKHAKSKLGSFSRGMLQRIGIAQAILNYPELLILDEPLPGLDPYGRQELKEIISSQSSRNATVFFSSHILSDVQEICDHIAILNKGRLLCSGSLKDLLPESGTVLEIHSCDDAVKELMSDASESVKNSSGDWKLSFRKISWETEEKIKRLSDRFPGKIIRSAAAESLENFFFHTIEQNDAEHQKEE